MFAFVRHQKSFRRSKRQIQPSRQLFLERLEERTLLSVHFFDNFEEASLNPFWSTVTQSGSITFPSTAQVHSGTQSVQFNSTYNTGQKDIELYHQFSQPIYGDFSVWAYDTGADASSGNYIGLYLGNSGSPGFEDGIVAYDYNFGNGSTYDAIQVGVNGSTGNNYSIIARTVAWHKFDIDATSASTSFFIDNTLVVSQPAMTVDKVILTMFGPTWRPAWVSYFDDFSLNPATHFSVSAPTSTTAGASFRITVSALDATNDTDTSYTGTVHFTSSDKKAVLPANYTFTAADAGVHTFSLTLKTAGNQSITAKDTVTTTITGMGSGITVSPAPASQLKVSAPASSIAGTAFGITVTALDPYGNVASGYTDTVHFTSSDKKAALPADYTFIATDLGIHTFKVGLVTAGSQTITATDTVTTTFTSKSSINLAPAAVDHLKVTAITSSTAGMAFSITVTAQDAFNNTVTGYTGTVHFTSSDIQAILPANYTFTTTNKGVHTFSSGVTLKTAGLQTVTATDTVTASVKASASVAVKPGKAAALSIIAPSSVTQGVAFTFTVTALDAFGNVATGYTGTVHFSSSDGAASLPVNFTFTSSDAGVETFAAILNTTGTQSLTATDTVTPSITGIDPAIQVS